MSNSSERDARSALRAKHYDLDTAETPSLLRRCFDRGEPRSVTTRGDIGIVDEWATLGLSAGHHFPREAGA